MTNRNDRKSDPPLAQKWAKQHGESRKKRHRKRPCGGNEPSAPSNLTFDWDVVEKGRHRRLNVALEWAPVRTNTAGAQSFMKRYKVQLQRSTDGTNATGKTRKWLIHETSVTKITAASIVSGTTAEFTLDRKHDFEAGDIAVVSGMTPGGYNGTWTVLAAGLTNTKFRANIGSSPGAGTAFGEAHENTHRVELRGVRKHIFYRFRVQAENKDGCVGDWSAWTSWTLANDHVAPPSPLNVKGFTNSTNRLVVDWDPPIAYLPIEGTVAANSGTATVTGTGTFFQTQLGKGDTIKLGSETKDVLSITNDTSLTVTSNWASTYGAGTIAYVEEPDPDVAYYEVWVGTNVTFGTSTRYKRDRYVHGTKKSFRVADADSGLVFYLWVRSVDASGNRSLWIPATAAGNSAAGTTPDGFAIGSGGGYIVATFTKIGKLRVKHYSNRRWTNTTGATLTFKKARMTVGDKEAGTGAPTGSAVKANIKRWIASEASNDNVFQIGGGAADDDRLIVNAGTYKDVNGPSTFEITTLLNDEALSVRFAQVGSGFPGEDATIQVFMQP